MVSWFPWFLEWYPGIPVDGVVEVDGVVGVVGVVGVGGMKS